MEQQRLEHSKERMLVKASQTYRFLSIGLIVLLVGACLFTVYSVSTKLSEMQAVADKVAAANLTLESNICKIYPSQDPCLQAKAIVEDPKAEIPATKGDKGDKGDTGEKGQDGRGVASFDRSSGNLIVTFSDGQTKDLGPVVGQPGKDGKNGEKGDKGDNGRGVLAADLVEGNLVVTFTDGTTENIGMIVGPRGIQGEQGVQGVPGTAGKDGATGPAGEKGEKGDTGATGATGPAGPAGEPGKDAREVVALDQTPNGDVYITYSDGERFKAGTLIMTVLEIFECNPDTNTFTIKLNTGSAISTTADCTPENIPGLQP
jgi:hypothetical protein